MHIMLVYFGLPMLVDSVAKMLHLKIQSNSIPILFFVILALTLSAGAYASEIIRSGILAVPKGQLEAAYAIGLTFPQAMRRYILPQAFGQSIPNLTNVFYRFFTCYFISIFPIHKRIDRCGKYYCFHKLKVFRVIYCCWSYLLGNFNHNRMGFTPY